jgi:hypothetical protein
VKKNTTQFSDPRLLFEQADGFSRAYDILSVRPRDEAIAISRPALVLSAFASELFLKCLLLLDGKQLPNWHDLKRLFDLLDADIQTKIKKLWGQSLISRASMIAAFESDTGELFIRDFDAALVAGARSFEHFRYYHEKTREEIDAVAFMLGDLPIMLKSVIWIKKPDWVSSYDLDRVNLQRRQQGKPNFTKDDLSAVAREL